MSFDMKGLMAEIEGEVGVSQQVPWWCCDNCDDSFQAADTPAECKLCQGRMFKGSTEQIAKNLAGRSKAMRAEKAAKPVASAADELKERLAKEKAELIKQLEERGIPFSSRLGNASLKKLLEKADQEAAQPEPEPVVEEPVVEEPVVEEEPEVVEEEPEVVEQPVDSKEKPDYKAIREKATKDFIKKHNLSDITPITVGTATVQTVGITIWNNGTPSFRFQQPFESGVEFGKVYDSYRATNPTIKVDCVQCNNVSNQELRKCLFNGDLIASLDNGNGTTFARQGQTVRIGALRTTKGNLRFVVLEVK